MLGELPTKFEMTGFQAFRLCIKGQFELFFCRKDVKSLLEALEEIRKAEEKNDAAQQALIQEIKDYAQSKEAELEKQKVANRQENARLVDEKEQSEQQRLETEKAALLVEAKEVQATLQARYDQNYQQAVDTIIERVKETYGRH